MQEEKWISRKDRSPELGQPIYVADEDGGVDTAFGSSGLSKHYTHWMPREIPKPPKKRKSFRKDSKQAQEAANT